MLTDGAMVKLADYIAGMTADFGRTPPRIQTLVRNLVERATEAEKRAKHLDAARDEVGRVMYHLAKLAAGDVVTNPAYYAMLLDRLTAAGFVAWENTPPAG